MLRFWSFLVGTLAVLAISQTTTASDKEPKFSDADFVKTAISGGMMEVELGRLGMNKAMNPDVKSFAAKMETDHTVLNKDLIKLAEAMKIEPPKKMAKKHQEMVDHMTNYTGKNFDRDFINHMVKDHETDIAEFKKASRDAKNAELKQFATKTLPTLEEHLRLAKEIKEKLDK